MKKILPLVFCSLLILGVLGFFFFQRETRNVISPLAGIPVEKPLNKYTFEALKKREFKASNITIEKTLKEGTGFTSYLFYFDAEGKRVSGLMNLPNEQGTYPIIVMFRGYVDKKQFTTGEGTRRSAEVFAENGFITLAPDFLGYGESDKESDRPFEDRFQTYTTAITLLSSVKNLNKSLKSISCKNLSQNPLEMGNEKWENGLNDVRSENKMSKVSHFIFQLLTSNFPLLQKSKASAAEKTSDCLNNTIVADPDRIGIWGHSNGGHISLSVLEITGKNYPTVLWAPVSKPFPYSILYFTDDFDDKGKALRKVLAGFEKDYDVEKYSTANFYNLINAPIQLHQGTDDESVPLKWSDNLNNELKKLNKDITYYTYQGENHNFQNGSWPLAIQRAIGFYNGYLNR